MNSVVAQFTIPYVQILNEQSQWDDPLPDFAKDHKKLTELYRAMVFARCFDNKAVALQRMGKMGTYAPCYGQEAIGAAIGHAMQSEDVFIPYYRDNAAQLQRGVLASEIFTYWGGDERGSRFLHQSQDLPICVPIASQCLHAAGVAFAFKHRSQPRVAVVCLGDGGTSEGDFYEAINVARLWQLPVVFVVNNNQWAISVPLNQQTAAHTLAQKAIAVGMDSLQVDGNDILAMRQVTGNAIEQARTGGGPTLIEALSFRLSDHTTADDATRYQPKDEVTQAHLKEPIKRMRKFLEKKIHWSLEQENALTTNCEQQVQSAIDDYLSQKPQSISSAFDYHFETLPEYLIEQRATAMENA